MPLVVFESSQHPPLCVGAPAGSRLVDVCDDHRAPVPFSCRSASCGTCRITVLEGADLIAPPADEEMNLLEMMGDDPARTRLACQATLLGGDGTVRVRASLET